MSLPLLLVLMALTTYRAARIVTRDDFPPVLWVRDRLAGGWRPLTPKEWGAIRAADDVKLFGPTTPVDGVENRYVTRAAWSPYWLAELVSCPWCCSGWLAGALTAAVALTTGIPDPWLVAPAVWAAAALLASRSWA
jgi:uncharacterized protein DUF1360